MPDNKKRRRRSTKGSNSSTNEGKTPETKMASSNANTVPASPASAAVFQGGMPLPTVFQPPRISEYPLYMPTPSSYPSDVTSKLDFILNKVSKLDSIESQQSTILSRLSSIE